MPRAWGSVSLLLLCLPGAAAHAGARCVAHRGNNVAELENSWASIRSAEALGADGIEFDVHHTSDGVGLLVHDTTLARVAEGGACPLDVELHTLTADAVRSSCQLRNGEEIPLLSDVLAEAESWRATLFVELKDIPSEATLALLETHRERMGDRLRVISFDKDALEPCESIADLSLYKLAVAVVAPGVRKKLADRWEGWDLMMVRKRRVKRVVKHGGEVAVWTVNSPKRLARMARRGVHWITTDDPQTCLQIAEAAE